MIILLNLLQLFWGLFQNYNYIQNFYQIINLICLVSFFKIKYFFEFMFLDIQLK